MDGWIDIGDQEPPLGRKIRVLNFITGDESVVYNEAHGMVICDDEGRHREVIEFDVTHWRFNTGADTNFVA